MASLMTLFKAAAFTVVLSGAVGAKSSSDSLPVVDLGYELYRASDFNETGGYYSFSNIRYAAPPVGDLRWQLPQPPAVNRSAIQDNVGNRVCPQTTPPWLNEISWLAGYLRNDTVPNNTTSSSAAAAPRDPSQNEDCLFLDVMVPQKIFEKTGSSPGAPVLVWIYGGGYGVGSKTNGYDARSLLSRSQANNSSGVIFVAMNYRLGALGFLGGPSFQAEGGVPNLGFRDQRLALDWIQQHIHRFGGDKDRVTVMGESAGAGSIMHHLTAFGGAVRAPFAQAVLQSPGWVPYPSRVDQEAFFRDFLRRANNASSLAAARALSTEQLMAANAAQMATQPYGSFGASPCLDGDFVTQDPKPLLAQGKYDKRVRILAAHNADEGLLFTPPAVADDAGYRRFVQDNFPAARRAQLLDYLAETLYPPVFDGSLPYTDHVGRVALTMAEATFVCNTRAVAGRRGASESDTFAYFWDVFPGLHSQDVQYTFYNPDTTWVDAPLLTMWGTNETVAFAMQDWFTSFAITGKPESGLDGLEGAFPHYGEKATMVSLSWEGVGRLSDPGANERCEWWQLALVG